MASYNLNKKARADLRDIYRYGLFHFGEYQADLYYEALFDCFENISQNPYLYQAVDDIRKGYRRCVYKSHSIYYYVKSERVEIMRILSAQDPTNELSKEIPSEDLR